jgi:hypothetical protein
LNQLVIFGLQIMPMAILLRSHDFFTSKKNILLPQ